MTYQKEKDVKYRYEQDSPSFTYIFEPLLKFERNASSNADCVTDASNANIFLTSASLDHTTWR